MSESAARVATVESGEPIGAELARIARDERRSRETTRAYATDWQAFVVWCRTAGEMPLPAATATVAAYLTIRAAQCSAGTLARNLAAIGDMHRRHDLPWSVGDATIRSLLRTRRREAVRRRAKAPTVGHLARLAATCPRDPAGRRDRALLLLLANGFLHAAVLGLDAEDIRRTIAGVDLALPDPRNPASLQWIAVPRGGGKTGLCAVRALEEWLDATDCRFGPVFRKVDRWGNVEHDRLHADAIRRIVLRRQTALRQRDRPAAGNARPSVEG